MREHSLPSPGKGTAKILNIRSGALETYLGFCGTPFPPRRLKLLEVGPRPNCAPAPAPSPPGKASNTAHNPFRGPPLRKGKSDKQYLWPAGRSWVEGGIPLEELSKPCSLLGNFYGPPCGRQTLPGHCHVKGGLINWEWPGQDLSGGEGGRHGERDSRPTI